MEKGHLEDVKNHFDDGYKLGTLDGLYAAYALVWLLIDSGVVSSLEEMSVKIDELIAKAKEDLDESNRIV